MMGKKDTAKAIALVSGGLDSSLALKAIIDQGIDVIALHFVTTFCRCDGKSGCGSFASKLTLQLGAPLRTVCLNDEYLEIVKHPKHGYGRNLNPCIDCRILKFKHAKRIMEEVGASFIVTGEVVGQRPMSQQKWTLRLIEKEARLVGLVLRPLSAQLLPPTIAEEKGWINRDKLLDFSGRSRKPQMQLADQWGIRDYPCPAGGCLLTDPGFSAKLKDLMKHCECTMDDVELLKTGRHFRLHPFFWLTVARNEQESNRLKVLAKDDDVVFEPTYLAGPSAIARGQSNAELIDTCARIVAYYTDKKSSRVAITVGGNYGQKILEVVPMANETVIGMRI